MPELLAPLGMSFVMVRSGWHTAGRVGLALGTTIFVRSSPNEGGQHWTPVIWTDEEDPDFFKSAGLVPYNPSKRLARRLVKRTEQW